MKILKLLNKKLFLIKLVCLIFFTPVFAEEKPIDIWNIEKKDNQVISETNISSENSSGTTQNSVYDCLLYTSPSPRDTERSRMPSSA